MLKKNHGLLTLSFLLFFTSCGDLFKKDVVKRGLESTRLRVNCELVIGDFSRILKDNISGTINCLADNLFLFMKLDELSDANYLNRNNLITYLQKNEPTITAKGYKIIDTIFEMNYLIYGESNQVVSKENLEGIVDLALVLNREAALIYDLSFGSHAPGTYASQMKQKERITNSVTVIRQAILKIYRPNRDGKINKINLYSMIEGFIKEPRDLANIKKLMFVKRILLGGESEELTHLELDPLMAIIPKIASLALDLVRYDYLKLSQIEEMTLFNDDVAAIRSIIFSPRLGNRDEQVLFDLPEAYAGISSLLKETKYDYDQIKGLLMEAKLLAMEGAPETVTGADLKVLLNHGHNVTKMGQEFGRFYFSEVLFPKMESKVKLNLKAADYTHLFPLEDANLKEFVRIANDYRFQPAPDSTAFYSPDYLRNSRAMFNIGMWEYIIKIFTNVYGEVSDGLGGKSLDQKQVLAFVKRYETELMDLGIFMPRKALSTSNTISLLGSLFEYQSNNNKKLDVNEATEFAMTYMSSSNSGKKLMDYFKAPEQHCDVDRFGRIEPNCFRDNFFKGFCIQHKDKFPSLMKYLGATDCANIQMNAQNSAFLDMAIKANRNCMVHPVTNQEFYYSQGDTMATILVIKHIETTILRWDTNLNNLMDADEVKNSFSVYKPAIEGMIESNLFKWAAELVFRYLVKFEKAPQLKSLADVKNILSFIRGVKAPADRKTIAAILKVVGEQSQKKLTDAEKFQCEWLDDPDNIPRDP